MEPKFVLMFCSTNLFEEPVKMYQVKGHHTRAAKAERIDIAEYLNRQLPEECQLCAISADGVIGRIVSIVLITWFVLLI